MFSKGCLQINCSSIFPASPMLYWKGKLPWVWRHLSPPNCTHFPDLLTNKTRRQEKARLVKMIGWGRVCSTFDLPSWISPLPPEPYRPTRSLDSMKWGRRTISSWYYISFGCRRSRVPFLTSLENKTLKQPFPVAPWGTLTHLKGATDWKMWEVSEISLFVLYPCLTEGPATKEELPKGLW